MHQENLLAAAGGQRADPRAVIAALNRREAVQLGQRTADIRSVERLEQVVDAVDLESFECILVVGRREDHRGCDLHGVEDAERIAVGQVDVHEQQVGVGIRTERRFRCRCP